MRVIGINDFVGVGDLIGPSRLTQEFGDGASGRFAGQQAAAEVQTVGPDFQGQGGRPNLRLGGGGRRPYGGRGGGLALKLSPLCGKGFQTPPFLSIELSRRHLIVSGCENAGVRRRPSLQVAQQRIRPAMIGAHSDEQSAAARQTNKQSHHYPAGGPDGSGLTAKLTSRNSTRLACCSTEDIDIVSFDGRAKIKSCLSQAEESMVAESS